MASLRLRTRFEVKLCQANTENELKSSELFVCEKQIQKLKVY